MKTILLCNEYQARTFRENAGLSPREAVAVSSALTLEGVRFAEGDLILEWPGWRESFSNAQDIVDALKRCIARGGNAGPQWVSSPSLLVT